MLLFNPFHSVNVPSNMVGVFELNDADNVFVEVQLFLTDPSRNLLKGDFQPNNLAEDHLQIM